MEYPNILLRGISDNNNVTDEGLISGSAFDFKPNPGRDIDYSEASINWVDDDGAISQILTQTKEKKGAEVLQFKYGYASIEKRHIDTVINIFKEKDIKIDYERYKLPDNKYHGNLLIQKELSKQTQRVICATISSGATPFQR